MRIRIRRRTLINSSLQVKLIGIFLFLGCLSALFQVVLLNHSLMRLSERMNDSSALLITAAPDLLIRNLLVTLAVMVPAMLVVGLVVTHRVAGPIYRMHEHLRNVARGNASGRCVLRKRDELQDFCDSLNEALERSRWTAEDAGTSEERSEAA